MNDNRVMVSTYQTLDMLRNCSLKCGGACSYQISLISGSVRERILWYCGCLLFFEVYGLECPNFQWLSFVYKFVVEQSYFLYFYVGLNDDSTLYCFIASLFINIMFFVSLKILFQLLLYTLCVNIQSSFIL